MALTADELDYCYEIASVIYQDQATMTNGFGETVTLTGLTTLRTKLAAYVANLGPSEEARIRECITLWKTVRLASVAIDGDIGCLHGISISAAATRNQIKGIFLIYIPVMTLAEGSARRDNAIMPLPNMGYIPVGG